MNCINILLLVKKNDKKCWSVMSHDTATFISKRNPFNISLFQLVYPSSSFLILNPCLSRKIEKL